MQFDGTTNLRRLAYT